jgi:hypothetical protein
MKATLDTLEKVTGGLSRPSKMPCHGWSISAHDCIIGKLLAKVSGTVCNSCYALKGRYVFPNVKKAHARRKAAMENPAWVELMTELIDRSTKVDSTGGRFFRWFDSGDLQGLDHLEKIVQIAKNLPSISFWLPTKQADFLKLFLAKEGSFPENLTVRFSAAQVGKMPNLFPEINGATVNVSSPEVFQCLAYTQGGKCDGQNVQCRACWKKSIKIVNYPKH